MERCLQAVTNAIETNQTIAKIETVADEFANTHFVRDTKKQAMKEKRPHGHNIEAVEKLKDRMDVVDCNFDQKGRQY